MSDEVELSHDIGHVEATAEQAQETADEAIQQTEELANAVDNVVVNYVSETEHAALRDRVNELESIVTEWRNKETDKTAETVEETPQEIVEETPETPQEVVMTPPSQTEKRERGYLFRHPLNRN